MLDFNFIALIYIYIDEHVVFFRNIILHPNVDRGILKTFIIKITLNYNLSAINHILRNLSADSQAYTLFQGFTFRLLHAGINDAGNARLRL